MIILAPGIILPLSVPLGRFWVEGVDHQSQRQQSLHGGSVVGLDRQGEAIKFRSHVFT